MCLALVGKHDLHLRFLASGDVNKVADRHRDVRIIALHRRIVEKSAWIVVLGACLTLVGAARLSATSTEDGGPSLRGFKDVNRVGITTLRIVERVSEPFNYSRLVNVILGLMIPNIGI